MSNNRRDFLKLAGLAGVSTLLPWGKLRASDPNGTESAGGCTLIPTETAGPFPLDLTANTYYFRQNIAEDQTGVPFKVRLKVIGADNCLPMPNVRVNIWHCNRLGLYSGYDENNNPDQAGLTYLRGYQMTDANGEVEFNTILPGWYNGRITHIHFQIYVSSSYAAISQMTFDVDAKNAIYTSNSSLYPNGEDPMSLASDNVFSDGYAYQMATLTENTEINGYEAYLEATIQGTGTTGVGHLDKQTAKQVVLGQNYPNPYIQSTTVPFELMAASEVQFYLFDMNGKKVYERQLNNLAPGNHTLELNMESLGLKSSNYCYQIVVTNEMGVFKTYKMMTALKK